MLDPYRMVFINFLGSLIVFVALLIYLFIYPKRKLNLFYLLIIISILPIISILRIGTYESGDFNIHIYRSIEFYKSLSEGNIIPSWAGNLNATYGYPLFSFNYILPYYFISLFHFIGFSFIASMKIFLGTNLVLSGIFMYIMSRNYLKNNLAAFSTSIFYIFVPYHLISVHFKITVGEVLVFTILPLIFLFINRFKNDKKISDLVLSGFFLGMLVLSHVYIAILTFPVLALYFLFHFGLKLKSIIYILAIMTIGIIISAFQWSAPIIYNSYLFVKANPSDISALYYPSISDLLYAPWRYGFLFQGPKGEISSLIGYVQIFIIIFLLFAVFSNTLKNKIIKSRIILWITLLVLLIIFMGPFSKPIWQLLPFIRNAGTHRILLLIAFITSILGGYFVLINKRRKLLVYVVIAFAIMSTILNWGQRTVIPQINDYSLIKNLPYSTSQGEGHFYANSKWVDFKHPWFSIMPNQFLDILKGQGSISNIFRSTTNHTYFIHSKTPIEVKENTLYFPGWEAFSNGKKIDIKPDNNGVITFNLPPGDQALVIRYTDLPAFALTKDISIASVILILIYLFYSFRKKVFRLIPKALDKN